jgi:hypothetical protein
VFSRSRLQTPQIILNFHDISRHLEVDRTLIREAASFSMISGDNVCLLVTHKSSGVFVQVD